LETKEEINKIFYVSKNGLEKGDKSYEKIESKIYGYKLLCFLWQFPYYTAKKCFCFKRPSAPTNLIATACKLQSNQSKMGSG
jgi:hypothetical protein